LEQLDAELARLEAQPELWTPQWREGKQAALSRARARVERSVAVAEERARVAAAHREALEEGGEGEGRARLTPTRPARASSSSTPTRAASTGSCSRPSSGSAGTPRRGSGRPPWVRACAGPSATCGSGAGCAR
ncbi:hypothetical protein PPSIR1_11988, partial [Plesiocystis pacifica SIR-1]